MPWLAGLLGNMLLAIIASAVARVLVSLGVSVVTYVGLDMAITWLKTNLVVALSGLPAEIVGMLALMKVGSCISMIFSALVMRMLLSSLTGGLLKSFVKD